MKSFNDFQKTKSQRHDRSMADLVAAFIDQATESKERVTYENTLQRAMVGAICAMDTDDLMQVIAAPDSKGLEGDRSIIERFKVWIQSERKS